MPRCRQNGAYQRCGAVNCRLRSPLAHDEGNLPLSEPVKGGDPDLKTAGNLANVGLERAEI